MLFNIYYINFPKVYEIKMILSNIIQTSTTVEIEEEEKTDEEIKANMGAKFLNFFNSEVGASRKNGLSDSQKVLEVFEVKTTKSVVLNEVIENSKIINDFKDVKEGALIRIDGVKLSLENEEELRTVKVFVDGGLKGATLPQVEGLDLNNALNSMFKDYSYKLKGEAKSEESDKEVNVMMKIPLTFENELESSYGVDDLFIGKVSIVGVYKGKIKATDLKNSFDFFQELGQNQPSALEEIQSSQYQDDIPEAINNNIDNNIYNYIDLLAIVQSIEPIGENKKQVTE